ncbi:hypothetical protein [Asticcacaulis benevestitus]|uniref:Uncharacterized protein n=1 Tax=Asticcacaulis benevestitus DSM 16100 = ATCC BAA-896 TaxID=1121022 RepID=V4PAA8_9CAUL|nr:hypothetical protein [Asticcacaulis benevestitus]ESQ84996.1 hypothetical protein ABENE_19460 [Asticcacaulis benevestitus DSM 16100 = ATCC BAA-896]
MGHLIWHTDEDNLITKLYPDYVALVLALPRRTKFAIVTRVGHLKIGRRCQAWTGAELMRLRRAWEDGVHRSEITKMFAPRKWETIYAQIKAFKKYRCHRRIAEKFRHPAVGSVRDKCKEENLPLAQLARTIGAARYFGRSDNSTSIASLIKAVHYLGGEIDIVWKDCDDL